jgi:hypothetical protein
VTAGVSSTATTILVSTPLLTPEANSVSASPTLLPACLTTVSFRCLSQASAARRTRTAVSERFTGSFTKVAGAILARTRVKAGRREPGVELPRRASSRAAPAASPAALRAAASS